MVRRPHYLYGPVPSRRLGLSLGVDIVPLKICTFDCVYCQLGRSSTKTLERRKYVPIDAVLAELAGRIRSGLRADYITISGSGEPTLNSGLGRLIDGIKPLTSIPVAVLTNGSLLYEAAARADCAKADLVLPSLDAGDEETFARINRPVAGLSFEKIVRGLCELREMYSGGIWLEVFMIDGINTDTEQIEHLASVVARIRPDKLQLNTAVRPTTLPQIAAVGSDKLESLAQRLSGIFFTAGLDDLAKNVEVIADFSHGSERQTSEMRADIRKTLSPEAAEHTFYRQDVSQSLLAMLKRRPCSLKDICSALGLAPNEALKHITELQNRGLIITHHERGKSFFSAE